MQADLENRVIRCFACGEDKPLDKIELNVLYEGSLSCEKEHLIGNQRDIEWIYLSSPCKYLMIYHNKLLCRCNGEETNCNGITDDCDFLLAKRSYEND